MCRKHLILAFAALIVIALAGCGFGQLLPSKKVPPLDEYETVVLLPFEFSKPSEEYGQLPTLISYAVGTKTKVRHEELNLIYDQSEEIRPVSDKLAELNLTANEVYENPAEAAKVAEAFDADLVVAGKLSEPKFTREDSGKIKYIMDEMTPSGTARYYTIYQSATLPSDVKIIKADGNEVIWDESVIGYMKYETDYRTGSPKKFEREDSMLADVRKDLVEKIVNKMYPK